MKPKTYRRAGKALFAVTIATVSLIAVLFLTPRFVQSACPDFVIEGFGQNTTGGCGGTVINVTNLNNSGAGSLRACLEASGTRICRPTVSGWVTLTNDIEILHGDLTLDGSMAPNGGFGVKGNPTAIRASNVIFRHVRFRPGACSPDDSCEYDSLSIDGPPGDYIQNIVLDHISTGWADDGTLDIVGRVRNVTVQWSLIHDSLGENGCSIVGQPSDTSQITIHHTLYYQCKVRNPEVQNAQLDFRNNVLYRNKSVGSAPQSFRDVTQIAAGDVAPGPTVNLVGNYYRAGTAENVSHRLAPITLAESGSQGPSSGVYLEGNKMDTVNGIADATFEYDGDFPAPKTSPYNYPAVTTTSAAQAYTDVLAGAGATLPCRDSVDTAVVANVQSRAGASMPRQILSSAAWPDLNQACSGGTPTPPAPPGNLRIR